MLPYTPPLVSGRVVRRYKRFLVDVRLGRRTVTAHCANPGSMRSCFEVGGRAWLQARTGRKLAYTWELSEVDGTLVCVNTARANELVADALARGALPRLGGYAELRREVAASPKSRLDFLLAAGRRNRDQAWVEVKTATMDGGDGGAAFPDSVTTRGVRHLDELVALRRRGFRAVLLFVVARAGASHVRPADEIDPAYGAALRRALRAGVELLAHGVELSPSALELGGPLPVVT